MISPRPHRSLPSRRSSIAIVALSLLLIFGLSTLRSSAETSKAALEAGKLNNVGVALMNQQLTEKAAAKFEQAHKADPSASIPVLNQGIALLYLQKLPQAEAMLKQAATMDPKDPHVWYALGLTHLDAGNPKLAIGDMERWPNWTPRMPTRTIFSALFISALPITRRRKRNTKQPSN